MHEIGHGILRTFNCVDHMGKPVTVTEHALISKSKSPISGKERTSSGSTILLMDAENEVVAISFGTFKVLQSDAVLTVV